MTQISPKSGKQTNTNSQNLKLNKKSYISGYTNLRQKELVTVTNSIKSAPLLSPSQEKPRSVPIWRQLFQSWGNLSIRTKLSLILVSGAAVPVIAVTQGLVWFSQQNAQANLEETLRTRNASLVNDYILWYKGESAAYAYTIAKTMEATSINLQNPKLIDLHRPLLQFLVSVTPQEKSRPDGYKSFRIITDAQGKTVSQYIQTQADYPLKGTPKSEEMFQPVSLPSGINLGDVPIVKNAIQTGRPLSGVELLEGKFMQRLGLDRQATIKLKFQSKDVEQGRAGLVTMAVHPIRVQGKLVGLALVGQLLNKHHTLIDTFYQYQNSDASIFAKDLQVSTTLPHENTKNRAVGTLAAPEVAEVVLNQKKEFFGQSNIFGQKYLTGYSPLYDHQQELNPATAKPVGMTFVAITPETVEATLGKLQMIGYSIGGGILLLAGIIAIPVAGSFSRPIRRTAAFAQQVGIGTKGVRLEATERLDEIGILSQELNQMAANIEANLESRQQEAERANFFANIATFSPNESQELNSIFDKALSGVRELLKAERAVIYRFNPDWSGYIAAESVAPGWNSAINDKIEDACIGMELIEAYKNGRFVPTNNVFEAGFHPEHMKLMERLQIKANLVTPIVNNSQLYGLLIAHHCASPHVWQDSEIDFLRQSAVQLGLILDRESLLEQQKVEAERAQMIKDITIHLAQTAQPEEIFDTAVQKIRQAIKSDRVVVYSFNQQWQGTVIAESLANGFPRALGAKIDDPCFADRYVEKYRQGRVQATKDIYKAGLTECHIRQLEPFAVKANLVAPILQAGKLLGLLIAHQCSASRAWQQAEIDLFSQFATQVGLALDRSNLLEQQKSAKELLQRRALELLMEVDPVSKGDLTIRASVTEDEIGTIADSYNATINSLRKIVTQVQAAAQQVTTTTSSSEGAVTELSHEALRQTAEISSAIERIQQMSDSIRAVASSAIQAEAAVQQATRTVSDGDAAMNRTVNGMMAIRETVSET